MKVLVTGGAGFIGSNIVDLLIDNRYKVTVVDNLSTGKKENLNPRAKFYKIDIRSSNLKKVFKRERPDYVLHQAAQTQVRKSILNPVYDSRININGSLNLLECCKKYNIEKIIYASSGGAVYGEPRYLPVDENHTINPISPYGVSKYMVESYLYTYNKLFGLDYIILRYSNVYGPRQDPYGEAGVIAIFIGKFLNKKRPMIFGDGNQTRDFVYVEDVAMANFLALKKNTKDKIFNIGTGKGYSVNEITRKIKGILDSEIKPIYDSPIKGEVRDICLNIKLSKKELGWKPQIDMDTGLKNTMKWFSKNV